MVRRNRNKRRGIQQGVEKHKIGSNVDEELTRNPKGRTLLGFQASQISRMAKVCFTLICRVSCSTYGLPMEFNSGKLSMATSWKHLLVHYTWLAAVWTFAGLKAAITFTLLLEDGLTIHTLMSIGLLLPCMCAGTIGIGNVFMVKETVQLVNSWPGAMECLKEPKRRPVSEFEDLTLSIKVIGITCTLAFCLPFIVTMTFLFPNLPVSFHNVLLNCGFGNSVPKIILQVCCIPLEFLLQLQPLLSSGIGAAVLVIGIDALKVYHEQLR